MLKKYFLFFFCFTILFFFTKHQTDGFSEWKLFCKFKGEEKGDFSENFQTEWLDQPFYYLGHGTQCFAFVSEDGKYVLKFHRQDRAAHPLKPLAFLLPQKLKQRLNQTLKKRENRQIKSYNSYKIAYESLRKETGLLMVQLSPLQNLCRMVTLYDKIGIVHKVDLSKTAFMIQKRAEPLYSTVKTWIDAGKLEYAEEALSKLVQLLQVRCLKGISDKDPDLKTNFGFSCGHPIQIDIGRFSINETEKQKSIYKNELRRITDRFCTWLETESPELASHVRKEIDSL